MDRTIRRRLLGPSVWTIALATWVAVAVADVWDPGDDSFASRNELVHGTVQQHELGPGGKVDPFQRDRDFFIIGQRPLSSYEVLVDGASNEIGNGLVLSRYQGASQVQSAVPTHLGPSLSLRWQNSVNSSITNTYVRVGATVACIFNCSSARSGYSIRSFDTTYSIPRFNNSSSQFTITLIQNTASYPVSGSLHFISTGGNVLGSQPFTVLGKQLLVTNTSTLGFAAGASGSVLVTNDGRYGDLSGKAVSIEPATGFTFDTQMVPKPL